MFAMDDNRARLAQAVEDAISDAGLEYAEVSRRAGFSVETLSKIRSGKRVRMPTLRKLEAGLEWPKGRADALLAGDSGQVHQDAPTGRVTVWEGELRDAHPLYKGEVLRWRQADRGVAYRLEVPHPFASIDYAAPEDEALDSLVEKLRQMIASEGD